MLRSALPSVLPSLSLLVSGAQLSPALAQSPRSGWFVEAGVGALRVPGSDATNITTRGTAPLATLRAGRSLTPRASATVSVGYGEVARARRDVYERPTGPTRTDTYDYRALVALAGAEYVWPASRAEVFAGLEGGWFSDGWRVAEHVDPAGLAPPRSSFGGGPAGAVALGLRYRLDARAALGAALRVAAGAGTLEGNGTRVLPELGVRWRF